MKMGFTAWGLVADAIALAIIFGYAYLVRKKGLIAFVFGALRGILSIVATWFCYPLVANFLTEQGLDQKLNAWIEKTASWQPLENAGGEGITGYIINGIEWKPLSGLVEKEGLLLNVISFAITFVLALIALSIVGAILKGIEEVPVLGSINSTLGFVLGFVVALLVVLVLLLVVRLLDLTSVSTIVNDILNNGIVLKLLYKYNPLQLFF